MSIDSRSGTDEKLVCNRSCNNSNRSFSSSCGMFWRIWWQKVAVIVIEAVVVVVVWSDVYDDKSKLAAWKSHYENLLNVEFLSDSSSLSEEQPFQGPPIRITTKMVSNALTKMKKGKAVGPSDLNIEMILAGGTDITLAITHLVNYFYLSSSWKHYHAISRLVVLGNCFMRMT